MWVVLQSKQQQLCELGYILEIELLRKLWDP